ncbi:MAG: ABC transporter ATP-binding protein [Candidatus Peregrinibacteria bacterium]
MPLRAILGLYARHARRYPLCILGIFVLYGIGTVLSEVIVKLSYRDIFDAIASHAPAPEVWPLLWHPLLTIVILLVVYNACFRVADFSNVYLESNALRDLTDYALAHLQKHSYSFFAGSFTGSLVAKVRRFVRAFETLFDRLVFDFWFIGTQLVGVMIVLTYTMPVLGLFFTLWCTAYIIVSYYLMRYRLQFDFLEAEADSRVSGQLSDVITNILNLKIFTAGESEMKRFATYTHDEYKARARAWYTGNLIYALQAIAAAILEVVGMYIALRLWLQGSISVGTVLLVQTYFGMILVKAWNIGRAMGDTFKALSDAEEMAAILRKPLEIQNPDPPEPCRIRRGEIAMRDVTFCYRSGREIFSDFSLVIPSGQRVGIVGHSGAGKSTLFKLLLRFVDVSDGAILIDGQDIRHILQDDLRGRISYVPQDPILFHRNLLENIAYAKPEASEPEVVEAAKRAHAHDFITALPQGYHTLVGERGIKLSGGERQRIALARVILKDAPILLLDEATSSLDSLSEKFIQEQLATLMHQRTTLAIAHRISTIRQMDRIIVLKDGAIVEDGTHDSLLARNGVYGDLWSHQSQGFIEEDGDGERET